MHILTFDIEQWWCNFIPTDNLDLSYSVKKRAEEILSLLEARNIMPTFFIVGEFAKQHPDLVRRIAQKYDIGSHGMTHNLVSQQSYKEFADDVLTSLHVLEDITGKKVTKYRAPGFSIPDNEYLKVLFDTPVETDCSLSAQNHFYGKKMLDTDSVTCLEHNGRRIKEFPPSVIGLAGRDLGFLGGGYFRLFPYFMIKKWLNAKQDYSLTYLHPSDFDTNQPRIASYSHFEKFKRYVGLKSSEKKLVRMLKDFAFCDVAYAQQQINWHEVPLVKI